MTRDRRTNERGAIGRLIDRLLGRDRGDRRDGARGASEGTPLFTAHQPPPSGPSPEGETTSRGDAASGATTVPAPEAPPAEPDLFDGRPLRRAPLDDREAEPPRAPRREPEPEPEAAAPTEPEPAPELGPEPSEDGLQTSVHEDALERVAPRARNAPGVRVHDDNLDQRSGPVRLTPSQAIELARGGRESLRRRDRD